VIGEVGGKQVAFIPRHGRQHELPPAEINYRANIWAMKGLASGGSSPRAVGRAPGRPRAGLPGREPWPRFKRLSELRGEVVHVKARGRTDEPDVPSILGRLLLGEGSTCVEDATASSSRASRRISLKSRRKHSASPDALSAAWTRTMCARPCCPGAVSQNLTGPFAASFESRWGHPRKFLQSVPKLEGLPPRDVGASRFSRATERARFREPSSDLRETDLALVRFTKETFG
jgi:hypothetical protein